MHENLWLQGPAEGYKRKDWPPQCNLRDSINARFLKACYQYNCSLHGRNMANDREEHFPSPAQCEQIKTKFCRHRYGLKGGDGPSLAPPIRHLRILLIACHQRKLRSKAVKGLCHTLIYAGVPRLVRFWRISWARLPEQNLIQNLLQDCALPKNDQMGHESLLLLAHPRDSQVKRRSWAPRNPVQNI